MELKLKEIGSEFKCPIAIMMRDGEILTGYRHYTKDKWKKISVWTTPGGRCEPMETIEEALRREVFEEVGINEFEILGYMGEAPGGKDGDTVIIFLCTTKQDASLMEPEKFSEWRWVSKDDFITNSEYVGFNSEVRQMVVSYFNNQI